MLLEHFFYINAASVVGQIKYDLLPEIFWNLQEHYNFLQLTQVRNYLQKITGHKCLAGFELEEG
jgi:hypothetical protein